MKDNFLIFKDFFGIFLIFYEFIRIYFELKRIKMRHLSCGDVAADVVLAKRRCHVAAYKRVTWRTRMHVCVCACAHVRALVHV